VGKITEYETASLTTIIFFALVMSALPNVANATANTLQITVAPGYFIQEAINRAQVGATIHIQKGIYIEENYPIIANKTVTLIGENVDASIIDGNRTEHSIFLVKSDGVKIKSLTIRNTVEIGFEVAAVHLANVKNVEVTDCKLGECIVGVLLKNASNSIIARNKITNNRVEGILMRDNCASNLIFGNIISNNINGVRTTDFTCTGNKIYHNNFVNNTYQTMLMGIGGMWDNGYPSGGNYWSCYEGVDYYSGPYKNVTGSDGVGDAPYGDGLDRYPFMGLIQFFNAGRWDENDYHVIVASNAIISDFDFNPNVGCFVKFNVTVPNEKTGFCRVMIPCQLLWIGSGEQWTVTANGEAVNSLTIDDSELDNTYFYFICTQGIQTIKISGTHAIPELSIVSILVTMALLLTVVILTKRVCA